MNSVSWKDVQARVMIGLTGILFVAGLLAANLFIVKQVGVGGEALLQWRAVRAFVFDRQNPYEMAVSEEVQERVYGRAGQPGEDPYLLTVPFYLLILSIPLAVFRDPAVAASIWLSVCEVAFLGFLALSLWLTDWEPRRFYQFLFFVLSFFGFYTIFGLFDASPVFLLALLYAGILFALRTGMDELAGALMALAFSHWEVGLLVMVLVLRRVFDEERWRVLAGFGMLTAVLLVISFFLFPEWPWPFMHNVLVDWRLDYGMSPGAVFNRHWPNMGGWLGWGLTGLLTVVLVFEWRAARGAEFRHFFWTFCLTLAITPLLGFRTEVENLLVLCLPLALIFSVARERWKAGYWLITLLLLVVVLVPWGLSVGAGLSAVVRRDLIFLFLPLFCLLGLYWIRWWTFRPPRTWLERAASNEYR